MSAVNDLPEDLFANPVITALDTTQAHLGVGAGDAIRYQADITPFAAVRDSSASALNDLRTLLNPGELQWVMGLRGTSSAGLEAAGLELRTVLEVHQMVLPASVEIPAGEPEIVPLALADVPAMTALTDVAFPGFFRSRTCEMGRYYGIPDPSDKGLLVAMGGERFAFPGYCEISCVCSHPKHRGKGYAASLIWEVVRHHRGEGIVSFLHVTATNQNAISLYRKLGFELARTIGISQVGRL